MLISLLIIFALPLGALETGANIRAVVAQLHQERKSSDVQALLRLTAQSEHFEGHLVAEGRKFAFQNDYEEEVFIDRLNLSHTMGKLDLVLGRQAITFGKSYFWNPLDVFFAFGARQFDRDYKPGVDALRVDYSLGDYSGLTFVGDTDGVLLLHLDGYFKGWDLALQGGKLEKGSQVGVGAVGEVKRVQIRFEGVYFSAPARFEVVLGGTKQFDDGLTLDVEYLFDNRHRLGVRAYKELTGILTMDLLAISDLEKPSLVCQPQLRGSLSDDSSMLFGMAFGDTPAAVFVHYVRYF